MFQSQKVLCLMGPTASGKTRLAIELSKRIPVRLISVDSAQIYKGLDIGAGKPPQSVLEKHPHALIDIAHPHEPYTVHQFCQDANLEIKKAFEQKVLPVLVGGTMMYFKALLEGMSPLPSSDPTLRQKLLEEGTQKGWEFMHQRLESLDPITAARLKPTDAQRIQRALEVYYLTGKPLSGWHLTGKIASPYEFISVGLMPLEDERFKLHDNIAQRFYQMIEEGLEKEVASLLENPQNNPELPAFRSVGYRQTIQCLQGEFERSLLPEKGIAATRQLAKRQLTWLRSWHNLNKINCFDDNAFNHLLKLLQNEEVLDAKKMEQVF